MPICNGSDRSCLSESEQTCLRCDSVKPLRLYQRPRGYLTLRVSAFFKRV